VFFPISTHFTTPPEIPFTSIILKINSFFCRFWVKPKALTKDLNIHLQTLYAQINPDNTCIPCITAAAGTGLADAYSPGNVRSSSLGKGVYNAYAFILHAVLLCQAFAHCRKFPTAAFRRNLDRVSVPVRLIILSDQLLIVALVGLYPTN